MKLKCILAAALGFVIGCGAQLKTITPPNREMCVTSEDTEALSYEYESCLRQQLKHLTPPQIDTAHSALDRDTRIYLSQRIARILGTVPSQKECLQSLPDAYCTLLSARSFEQLGAISKAHQVYQTLHANGALPHAALAGLIRTETQPDTAIPSTAKKHPDYLAATCVQMVKHAPNEIFPNVVKECLAKAPRSSAVLSELAKREWLYGFHLRSIRRLENHLQADPLDHRIRSQLALYLFDHQAYVSAIDHIEQLTRYQSITQKHVKNLIFALIRTQEYERARQRLDAQHPLLTTDLSDALSLHLNAHQGACTAIKPSQFGAHSNENTPSLILGRLALIKHTPCEFMTEAILIRLLRAHVQNADVWTHLVDYYTASGQQDLASKTLNEILTRFPTAPKLYHLAAQLHHAKGQLELASDQVRKARALDPENLEYRRLDTQLTFRMGKFAEAVKLMTTLVRIDPHNIEVAKKLALAKLLMNDLDHAVNLLKWLSEIQPENEVLRLQYATTLVRLDSPIAAKKALLETIATKPDYGDAWALLAITHAGLDELSEAEHAFKKALSFSPSHRHLRVAYARFLESQNQELAARIQYERLLARSPKDEEATQSIARMKRENQPDPRTYNLALKMLPELNAAHLVFINGLDTPAIVINDQRDVTVQPDGDLEIDVLRTILIKHESAVPSFSKVEIPYDTSFPPEVVTAVVITPEGIKRSVGLEHLTHLNPNRGSLMFGDARTLKITFPNLESGSVVHYRVRTRLPKKPETMVWWDSYVLGNEVFTLSAAYSMRIPTNQNYTVTGVGLTEQKSSIDDGFVHRRWTADLVPSFSVLSRTQQPLPMIYLSSFDKWSDVDRWYTKLFSPATTLGPKLRLVAQNISERFQETDARISAVIETVESRVSYEGVEYGVGAYLPRPAESSWLRRKGDCKDMVALIVGLLKSMKIEAHPVLIRPRDAGPFMVHYPSPSQFSHVIVIIKGEHGKMFWVDPTARMGTLDALPALVRGAPAFIVDSKGGRVTKTPLAVEHKNIVRQTSVIEVADNPRAQIRSVLSLSGDAAGWGRIYLRTQTDLKRHQHLFLPGLMLGSQVIPDTLSISTLEQSNQPLNIQTAGYINVGPQQDHRRVFKGILDPTASSFIALLNSSDQINAPKDFRKITTFKFIKPHRLATRIAQLNLSGPITLHVSRTGSPLEHRIEVVLSIDHTRILHLNESDFMESLRRAQSIMEQELVFVGEAIN